jgi:hypothetical protein
MPRSIPEGRIDSRESQMSALFRLGRAAFVAVARRRPTARASPIGGRRRFVGNISRSNSSWDVAFTVPSLEARFQ